MTPDSTIQQIFKELCEAYKPINKELNAKFFSGEINSECQKIMFPSSVNEQFSAQMAEAAFLKYNCGILTAYRGGRSIEKNEEINSTLQAKLDANKRKKILDYRLVKGCFKEVGRPEAEPENSFFVFDADENRFNASKHRQLDFFTLLYNLSEAYEQDSFLYKCAGMSRQAFLINTNNATRQNGNIDEAGFLYLNLPAVDFFSKTAIGRFAFRKNVPTEEELAYSKEHYKK